VNRVVGLETEYGALVHDAELSTEAWPARVKNYIFRQARAGALDLHYRDYEEPPGNGGFLLNGGRLYLDMGHIEYASPECRQLRDVVAYDLAGDQLLQSALDSLGANSNVSFIKNNIDHHTGATFGCHENYLMKREAQFTPAALGALLAFLATRQIFTGAGRVGQANPLARRDHAMQPLKGHKQLGQKRRGNPQPVVTNIVAAQPSLIHLSPFDHPYFDEPRARRALDRLSGAIPAETMRKMNAAVDRDRKAPRDVAREFLAALPQR